MPGWAEIDERHGLFVLSWSSMVAGRRANGWVRSVDQSVSVPRLGALVREALAESRTGVPMVNFRDPAQDPMVPLLTLAGVKSWDGYARDMRACFVDLDDEQPGYLFRPTRNESRGGLVDLPEALVRPPTDASDELVGEAALAGVDASVGHPPSMWRGRRWIRPRAARRHGSCRVSR